MSKEATGARLAARTSGPVWSRAAADHAGYDEGRSGFNSALDHQPALALAAVTSADVVEGIRLPPSTAYRLTCKQPVTEPTGPWMVACWS